MDAVLAEGFNLNIRILHKRPVFEGGDDSWIVVLPKIAKQYKN